MDTLAYDDALRTIRYSNTCILVIDAQQPLTREDLLLANLVASEGRALIIAANKWDLISEPYQIAHEIEQKILSGKLSQVLNLFCYCISCQN